ncbi:MAG: hypothetical protein H8E35_11135 [Ardenticatenia bacterium]|nr:hypothetical protein [Ardenticatenia bacterium]
MKSRRPSGDLDSLRLYSFSVRVNLEEQRMLLALAKRLRRTRSDAVRWLVCEAARELGLGNNSTGSSNGLAHKSQGVPYE